MRIEERIERKRRCGWRKPGGIYVVSGGMPRECGKLPFPLVVCPICHSGIKFSRGWTWINLAELLKDKPCRFDCSKFEEPCILNDDCISSLTKVGLLWIGEKFYTATMFAMEANDMGISRRIPNIPRGFELGKTWIALAHRKSISDDSVDPAIMYMFKPTAIEYIVGGSESEEKLQRLVNKGVTLVNVTKDLGNV